MALTCDWPPPLGTVVRQRLAHDYEANYETWSIAYTVVEHMDQSYDGAEWITCGCIGEDIGGNKQQFFFMEAAMVDGVKIESFPAPRVRLGRVLEL